MKRTAPVVILLFLVASLSAIAEGGGGIEYIGNVGSNAIPALAEAIAGEQWLDVRSGSIAGFGGFGYGVTWENFKIGGFGFGFLSGQVSKPVPVLDAELVGLAGGFGGVILGSQYSAGPIVLALNTRLGVGGLAIDQTSYPPKAGTYYGTFGTVGLYGHIDVEAGVVIGRNMLLSAYAGTSGILAFTFWDPPVLPLLVPVFGARITWGSF